MNNLHTYFLFTIILITTSLCVFANNDEVYFNFEEGYIDMVSLDDEKIRVNPQIEMDSVLSDINLSNYPYLNLSKNIITYNNADWSTFYYKLSQSAYNKISILHIGDSHLQADIATRKTRKMLQEQFGYAGRGLICPFKLAKTNEPIDYNFKCYNQYSYSSLMKRPWQTAMRMTGVAFSPKSENFKLSINTSSREGKDLFQTIRLHVQGDLYIDSVRADNNDIYYDIDESSPDHTDITFDHSVSSVDLWLSSIGRLTVFGATLINNTNGVIYNVIGNNGAAYDSYNRIGNMGSDCAIFSPDLIIVSLGTNEAFGTISDDSFYRSIDKFVSDMQHHNPDAPILLVTPMECQRKGRINSNIKRLRDVILKYGEENNVAVYDWYEVAGGYDASRKWHSDNLMGGDRIHNTGKGYNLQGTLLYEALIHDLIL